MAKEFTEDRFEIVRAVEGDYKPAEAELGSSEHLTILSGIINMYKLHTRNGTAKVLLDIHPPMAYLWVQDFFLKLQRRPIVFIWLTEFGLG